jgi:hypothetical protein
MEHIFYILWLYLCENWVLNLSLTPLKIRFSICDWPVISMFLSDGIHGRNERAEVKIFPYFCFLITLFSINVAFLLKLFFIFLRLEGDSRPCHLSPHITATSLSVIQGDHRNQFWRDLKWEMSGIYVRFEVFTPVKSSGLRHVQCGSWYLVTLK